jgi:hypothetical protein
MNIFELNRAFWDFAFNNPEKIKPNHCAIYYFALEHCNRLGWKQKFGFPTSMVLEATGIKSYSVYKKTFDELVSFGFFEVIEYSKNQYSSNIIALKENTKATTKALDKAMIKHSTKHSIKQDESIDSINKQVNKEQINNETIPSFDIFFEYVKTLKSYKEELDYAVKVKYNNWVDNKWRDGNNDEIKNWKNKIMNTMAYMKVIVDPNKPIDLAEYFKNRL